MPVGVPLSLRMYRSFRLIMSLSRSNKFAFKSHSAAAPVRQKVAQSCGTGDENTFTVIHSRGGLHIPKTYQVKNQDAWIRQLSPKPIS